MVEMDRHYMFSGLSIKVSCEDEDDRLFSHMDSILSNMRLQGGKRKCECSIFIKKTSNANFKVPKKAVRFQYYDFGTAFAYGEQKSFLVPDNFAMGMNYRRNSIRIEYAKLTDTLIYWQLHNAVIWLISSALMKRGSGFYINANFVSHKGKTIALMGRESFAKSNLASQLFKEDYKSIFEHLIISNTGAIVLPVFSAAGFNFKLMHMHHNIRLNSPTAKTSEMPIKKADCAVFVDEWNYGGSECVPISREKAIARIFDPFCFPNTFFSEHELSKMRTRYRKFFRKTKFYNLFAGHDAKGSLETLLKSICR